MEDGQIAGSEPHGRIGGGTDRDESRRGADGDAAFVFLPGEPLVELALAIREASPWDFTAVVGCADDYIGYIPTNRVFENGGYEIGPGRWSRLAAGSDVIVRQEA